MDQILPLELLEMIFEKLSLKDLLNCKLVSFNFKFIVDQIKLKELTIRNGLIPKIRINWFHTNQQFKNIIATNHKYPIHRLFESSILQNLKSLMINYLLKEFYPKFDLNNLQSLEQLQIDYLSYPDNYKLELRNLRILFLNNVISPFVIDCPKLQYFHHPDLNHVKSHLIKLNHPESIKHLELYRYCENNSFNLADYTNIEYLIINQFQPNYNSYPNLNDQINFKQFTKLNCIHIFPTFKLNSYAELSFIERIMKNNSFDINKIKIYLNNQLVKGHDQSNRLIISDNEFDQQLIDNERIDYHEASVILRQILNNQI